MVITCENVFLRLTVDGLLPIRKRSGKVVCVLGRRSVQVFAGVAGARVDAFFDSLAVVRVDCCTLNGVADIAKMWL
jgi:hypothetical protein